MFKLPYLYYYLIAWLLLVCLQRIQNRQGEMKGPYPTVVFGTCTLSIIVFLILGFWFMPKWWYPLVFSGLSIAVGIIPIPDKIGAILAVIFAPILCGLAYLSMFGVI